MAATLLYLANYPAEERFTSWNDAYVWLHAFCGAMFLSVSPSVFSSHLVSNIEAIGRDSDTTAVLAAGATNLASAVPAALLPDVQEAYNHAVRHVFIVSVALSCRAAITAAVVE